MVVDGGRRKRSYTVGEKETVVAEVFVGAGT